MLCSEELSLNLTEAAWVSPKDRSGDEGRFSTDPDEAHTPLAPDAVIDNFDGQRITTHSRDFSLVTGRRHRKTQRQMRDSPITPS